MTYEELPCIYCKRFSTCDAPPPEGEDCDHFESVLIKLNLIKTTTKGNSK